MAMANVTGNPKRTIATILTMGLSCVLFVIISNYVGNIDTEHEARIAINYGQFELQLDYSQNYDEAYSENNLDTILQNNPLNDSLIKEIKSIPGVTDVLTREIVSADLNGTKFPVAIVNQEDFEMMRGDGDIGSMDYAQAVKTGMFSLAGPRGWKLTGILRVHRLHSTLITEAEPIPIMENRRLLCKRGHVSGHSGRSIPLCKSERDILWIPVGGLC